VNKVTIPATIDSWFITVIVKLCLQHDAIARVHLRRLIFAYLTRAVKVEVA